MKIKRILYMGLFLISCSPGRYLVADRYLEQYDYQNALQEYSRIAGSDGSVSMSHDIHALLGAMISYYNLGEHKKSFAIGKRVLSLNKYNSCAIFYVGMNLEMLNKESLARKVFYYYQALSRSDPFYKLIKAKYNELVQQEMEKRVQMAMKMESSLSADQISDKTLAVLYFLNVADDSEWSSLSKGLAEMMITDLSQVKSIKVLERLYLQKLLEEMQLGISGLADESTAPRLGRLMKARNLINGSFSVKSEQYLTVNANVADIVTQSGSPAKEFSGVLKDIFVIEKKIVFAALEELGIELTVDEKKRLGKFATQNFEAFKAYCKGLDQYDLGDYQSALSYFERAIQLDPGFILAQDMCEITDAIGIIEQKKFSSLYINFFQAKLASGAGIGTINSTQYRLNQLSLNLDLGYLPGNDSRNGASEIIGQDQFWSDDWWTAEPLAPPPVPPKPPVK